MYRQMCRACCRILTGVCFPGIEMEIVNSCEASNGGCSHTCHHTSSGPVCTCNFGYRLEEDQKTCTGKAREKVHNLVFTSTSRNNEDLRVLATLCMCTTKRLTRLETDAKGKEVRYCCAWNPQTCAQGPPWTLTLDFRTS